MQRRLFELMFRKGWYELEQVDNNKLKEKYNLFSDDMNTIRTICRNVFPEKEYKECEINNTSIQLYIQNLGEKSFY